LQYHGWQFGSGGKCESIPSEPTTRPGKPFCVYAYPTTEVYVHRTRTRTTAHAHVTARTQHIPLSGWYFPIQDLVWVWPGDPEKASEQRIPHHLFKEYRDTSWGKDTVTRDFDL
jgi:phenylpropionate dioxygenase-like ring-hydroxylating dioxygenase large terminal subunit